MSPEETFAELGCPHHRHTAFHPAMAVAKIAGNLLYFSGATPLDHYGTIWAGRIVETYSVEQGYQATHSRAAAQLAMANTVLGDLSRIKQIVKVLGMVNCAPGFTETPAVMHGFSDLLYEVLGEKGRHARSAGGMQALPGNTPVEVETIFEIEG